MRLKPRHVIWVVVAVVLVPLAIYLVTSDLPGRREQSGDVVTKTLASVEAKAASSFDITLQQGADAAHEADHVFDSVKNPAVASASFNVKTLELEVRYDDALIEESDIRQLLITAGYVKATTADAVPATLSSDGKSQELSVQVGEKLDPASIRAKAGVPLRIVFGQGTGHLASISIAELGVEQDLTKGGATVTIQDPKAGTYGIVDAEGYTDGTLIVE
ncbi:MAG: hypothetical protein C0418_04435 [Coriobacteriaceae bacterium]|nr:hypothetical protein [Coriobacteriaceae bacterium]